MQVHANSLYLLVLLFFYLYDKQTTNDTIKNLLIFIYAYTHDIRIHPTEFFLL
jgi:hypothetical protein